MIIYKRYAFTYEKDMIISNTYLKDMVPYEKDMNVPKTLSHVKNIWLYKQDKDPKWERLTQPKDLDSCKKDMRNKKDIGSYKKDIFIQKDMVIHKKDIGI